MEPFVERVGDMTKILGCLLFLWYCLAVESLSLNYLASAFEALWMLWKATRGTFSLEILQVIGSDAKQILRMGVDE